VHSVPDAVAAQRRLSGVSGDRRRRCWNKYEADAALARMTSAGAEPVTTFALACELQEDWKSHYADAMLDPFKENLSEYGFVLENYWNARGHVVADPFARTD
jgi:hypothetical protein